MIEIDGSFGEGGGQIIRTSLALSAITKKPVHISNIRAGRPNPGLAAQHLASARAVRSICRGALSECEIGSTSLSYTPGEICGGKYEFDIGTAGSCVLVSQAILPILLFATKPSTVRITGGTHVMKSPSYDYFENVFLPAISLFGARAKSEIIRAGYYPRGGGEMLLAVEPSQLNGNSAWPKDVETHVIIRISGLPPSVAVREKKIFVENGVNRVRIVHDECGIANSLTAWSGFFGACPLGEKGKRSEQVSQEALDFLRGQTVAGSEVDSHLADQLLIYAALASGPTKFRASIKTEHTKTNLYVISKFMDRKFEAADSGHGCEVSVI